MYGIELEMGDPDSARFEDRSERGGGDSLAEGRNDATGDENVFDHGDGCSGKARL
jgi:hypothetical protein